jgi:hypothetical protein
MCAYGEHVRAQAYTYRRMRGGPVATTGRTSSIAVRRPTRLLHPFRFIIHYYSSFGTTQDVEKSHSKQVIKNLSPSEFPMIRLTSLYGLWKTWIHV